MKRWIACLLCLTLLLGVSACVPKQPDPPAEGSYGLWFAVDPDSAERDLSAVGMEKRTWESQPTERQLLQTLLDGPTTAGLKSPFPDGVKIRSVYVDPNSKTAQVNLSEQYGGLAGVDLTIADYCIALTLCQIPEIQSVRIKVEGQYLSYRDRQQLSTGDVLFSGINEEPSTFLAALYFPNQSGSLTVEYRQVSRDEGSQPAQIVLQELQRGPSGNSTEYALPDGTQILSVEVDRGVCKINVSKEFLTNAPNEGKQAGLSVYALVNSLCALSGISQVQILVDGQKTDTYGGISLAGPISANYDLADMK